MSKEVIKQIRLDDYEPRCMKCGAPAGFAIKCVVFGTWCFTCLPCLNEVAQRGSISDMFKKPDGPSDAEHSE